ncbi:MAG: hypothetical protein LBV23_09090 [Deltaproteobacteria bacterium]|nr:hypothetical protein [Deltaproteobacteria bacterium]
MTFIFLALGLFITLVGFFSLMVGSAYSHLSGASIASAAGGLLIVFGALFLFKAVGRFFRTQKKRRDKTSY